MHIHEKIHYTIGEKASPKKQNYMLLKVNSQNSAQLHKHNDGCQNVNIKENVEAIKSDYFFNKKNLYATHTSTHWIMNPLP